MPKKVKFFGRNSLDRAREYVAQHPGRDLVLLKNTISWRIAVCSSNMAEKLRSQGFTPIES